MKILILGASNTNRPPVKTWPEYLSEIFKDVHFRNAAYRGITCEHLYDCFMLNKDYEPDLILCDLPPWYRNYIPVADKYQKTYIKRIDSKDNYDIVTYSLLKGSVPIGGYLPKHELIYSEWLKKQMIPNRDMSLYDVYRSYSKDRDNFDDLINMSYEMRYSEYYYERAVKDVELLRYATGDIPIRFIHTIGPIESVDVGDFLCESAYKFLNGKNYSDKWVQMTPAAYDLDEMYEDEWVHLSPIAHKIVAHDLYAPALRNLLNTLKELNQLHVGLFS